MNLSDRKKLPDNYARFFKALGRQIRQYRHDRKLSQEDMISFGFSVRHWQHMETGRPFTLVTLLRIADAFEIPVAQIVDSAMPYLKADGPEIAAPSDSGSKT